MDQFLVALSCLQGKSSWTNGPESSSEVSPETGVGPWMALPNLVSQPSITIFVLWVQLPQPLLRHLFFTLILFRV